MVTDGGCALVLCNTVARAQAAYELLQPVVQEDLRLLHARFIASDRVAALCMIPRTAEVIVRAPALRTPRMPMHRCSASTTTITPRAMAIPVPQPGTMAAVMGTGDMATTTAPHWASGR